MASLSSSLSAKLVHLLQRHQRGPNVEIQCASNLKSSFLYDSQVESAKHFARPPYDPRGRLFKRNLLMERLPIMSYSPRFSILLLKLFSYFGPFSDPFWNRDFFR